MACRSAWPALTVTGASPSLAQEPYYKGKTIRLIISVGVAGGFGEYARTLAEHYGRHIPGNPNIIVQSMPGAGGLIATNHLYVQAPQDGTVDRHGQCDRAACPAMG